MQNCNYLLQNKCNRVLQISIKSCQNFQQPYRVHKQITEKYIKKVNCREQEISN